MILAALTLSVVAFIVVLRLTGAVAIASEAAATARDAARALRSDLDDTEKEARSRRAAAALLASFVKIAAIGVGALALSSTVIWLGAAAGLYDLAAALALAGRWSFILAASVVATLAWVVGERFARRTP